MNLIVHKGRVGKADPAFPWPEKSKFLPDYDNFEKYNRLLESCLSHATWFEESDNERAYILIAGDEYEKGWSIPNGPYSVENFPEVEEVKQWAESTDSTLWYDVIGDARVDVKYRPIHRTVLRFKQEPKEEPTPTGSQVKWEPKIINEFLDASQFKGNDRINHFLLQAIRQLDTDEIKGLIDGLSGYVPKEEPKTGESQEEFALSFVRFFVNFQSFFIPQWDNNPEGLPFTEYMMKRFKENDYVFDSLITRKQTEQ